MREGRSVLRLSVTGVTTYVTVHTKRNASHSEVTLVGRGGAARLQRDAKRAPLEGAGARGCYHRGGMRLRRVGPSLLCTFATVVACGPKYEFRPPPEMGPETTHAASVPGSGPGV